jgi:hypothetical protein
LSEVYTPLRPYEPVGTWYLKIEKSPPHWAYYYTDTSFTTQKTGYLPNYATNIPVFRRGALDALKRGERRWGQCDEAVGLCHEVVVLKEDSNAWYVKYSWGRPLPERSPAPQSKYAELVVPPGYAHVTSPEVKVAVELQQRLRQQMEEASRRIYEQVKREQEEKARKLIEEREKREGGKIAVQPAPTPAGGREIAVLPPPAPQPKEKPPAPQPVPQPEEKPGELVAPPGYAHIASVEDAVRVATELQQRLRQEMEEMSRRIYDRKPRPLAL